MSRYVLILSIASALLCASEPVAPVEVVVYSDFQCPFCKQFAQPIRELQAKGVEGVPTKVTFKNFPLPFHSDAQLAHQAALAAGEQGKFWEMHDLLFANQSALKREGLLRYAEKLGLDMNRFRKDLDSDRVKRGIEQEKAEGSRLGVNGTPTFFVGGKSYTGARSFEQLTQLVQGEERRKQALAEISDALLSKGPEKAPVLLEFFADLESPVSRSASYVLDELISRYESKIRIQFHNYPLAFHPQAALAHEAAMVAARQGHFWQFANYILDHQESLREQDLIAYAGRLGLDQVKFAEVLQQHRYAARVDADLAEGFKRGVRGSPVIFVNDKRIDGVPSLATLTKYVEEELTSSQPKP